MTYDLISVIMPVYKVDGDVLKKSINSVIEQTYDNIELILVDDGSNDYSSDICDEYSKINRKVKVIHKDNKGVSSARNEGIRNSNGKYIFFIDSDDTIEPSTLMDLFLISERNNDDVVCCNCHHLKRKPSFKNDFNDDSSLTVDSIEAIKILAYNRQVFDEFEPTCVWGKLYKKEIIKDITFNEKMYIAEDFEFNLTVLKKSKKITYINKKLYNYNCLSTSIMNNKVYSERIYHSFCELKKILIKSRDCDYYEDIIARCVNIAFTIYYKIPEDRKKECIDIEEFIKSYRRQVLMNQYVNKKVKMALCLSYFGFKLNRKIFELVYN